MNTRRKWIALGRLPMVKQGLFLLGCFMILVSPLVGIIPGPGGVLVFAFGFGLVLKYSNWAKRQYVRFKSHHPNKGRWADWSLRRQSARRREAIRGGTEPAAGPNRQGASARTGLWVGLGVLALAGIGAGVAFWGPRLPFGIGS